MSLFVLMSLNGYTPILESAMATPVEKDLQASKGPDARY